MEREKIPRKSRKPQVNKKEKHGHVVSPKAFAKKNIQQQTYRSENRKRVVNDAENFDKPEYDEEWLYEWLIGHPTFDYIYYDWVESKDPKHGNKGLSDLSPSVDRIDNTKGYTKDNIQFNTWADNRRLAAMEKRKPVFKYTLDGDLVNEYDTIAEAAGSTHKYVVSTISSAITNGKHRVGNYLWFAKKGFTDRILIEAIRRALLADGVHVLCYYDDGRWYTRVQRNVEELVLYMKAKGEEKFTKKKAYRKLNDPKDVSMFYNKDRKKFFKLISDLNNEEV